MQHTEQRALALTVLMATTLACGSAAAQSAKVQGPRPTVPADRAAACAAMRPSFNFSPMTDYLQRIPDAPATIASAAIVPPERGLPEICRIEGHIAPNIGFVMKLPTQNWNGRMLMGGCGGPCGNIPNEVGEPALARNYAVVATDMGHKGKGWVFGYQNLQGLIDYGSRATHVSAVVGKELVNIYYGQPAKWSYFNGCSTGGRQAMVEAQRFPEDFNGIIAGAPPYYQTGDTPLFLTWGARANMTPEGKTILDAGKLPMIHKAVMAACASKSDMLVDSLQNPAACAWDPGVIVCKTGGSSDSCLTPAEAEVVRKIYTGAVNSKGRKLYFGMPRGSELTWAPSFVNTDGKPGNFLSGFAGAGNSMMTYASFFYAAGPTWRETDFDYDRDPPRLAVMEALYGARNHDLREFKAAGGKMLLYHGWNDYQIPAGASVDYYETATRVMGGPAATRDFFRLFMLPGVGHCIGGAGGSEFDGLTAIENWVEKGQAPEQIVVHKMKVELPTQQLPNGETIYVLPRHPLPTDSYERARPVYPYPDLARWSGKGSPDDPKTWVRQPQ
jgi:hypothetical protein